MWHLCPSLNTCSTELLAKTKKSGPSVSLSASAFLLDASTSNAVPCERKKARQEIVSKEDLNNILQFWRDFLTAVQSRSLRSYSCEQMKWRQHLRHSPQHLSEVHIRNAFIPFASVTLRIVNGVCHTEKLQVSSLT